jgi:ribosome recycling factor
MHPILAQCESQMKQRVQGFEKDLARLRTGRASISLLDGVRVDYYGTLTPLNQVAAISTPDARSIVVAPFEKKLIAAVERGIQMADIGIQPMNDGNVIRLPIPPLNEERRKEFAKNVKKCGEDAKVSLRKIRQDINTDIKKAEKDKSLNEDDSKKLQKDVQKLTDDYCKVLDEKTAKKEQEVLSM